jgi:hypothetical protein
MNWTSRKTPVLPEPDAVAASRGAAERAYFVPMGGNDDSCAGRGGGDTAEGDRFWCWRRVLQQRAWMVWWVRVQVGCSRFLGSDLVVGGLGKGGSRLGLTLLLGSARSRSLPACWSRTTGSPARSRTATRDGLRQRRATRWCSSWPCSSGCTAHSDGTSRSEPRPPGRRTAPPLTRANPLVYWVPVSLQARPSGAAGAVTPGPGGAQSRRADR